MINQVYRNIKTGNLYIVTAEAINTTNSSDGIEMIIYREFGTNHKTTLLKWFVRDKIEFFDKFELLEGDE